MSSNTSIPLNRVRKTSRALIDRVWQSGNRRPGYAPPPVEEPAPPAAFPDRRAEIAKKIERIAARRIRERALQL